MNVPLRALALGALLTLPLLTSPPASAAESAADFYKGLKTIDLLIGSGPGSSYDVWARVVGKHWSKHLPGNPVFVVKAMPGAGSLIMANYLYNQVPKDGSVIGSFSPLLPTQVVIGIENAHLDPREFGYIGSPETSNHVCVATAASGVSSIDDAKKKEVLVAGTGATTVPSFIPPILNELAGTKFKVIEGYKSNEEAYLAMERGEVDGFCSKLDSIMRAQGDKVASGDLHLLFTLNEGRVDSLNGVPSAFEFIEKPEDKKLMSFIRSSAVLGRPFAAPPGIPDDRLALLRSSFEETMKDPAFLDELKTLKLELTYTPGEKLHAFVQDLYDTPPETIKRASAFMGAGG
jgi:tripartite-type tricarboxylate transporter receptor subunit TctC